MKPDIITVAGAPLELPGVVRKLSNQDYHEHFAPGSTAVRNMFVSPGEARNPKPFDADAQAMGTAFHWLIGEPEEYENLVAFDPVKSNGEPVSRNSNAYLEAKAAHMERTGGRGVMLKPAQHERVRRMGDAFWAYKWLPPELIEQPVRVEWSIFWRDRRTGIVCKARPDLWIATRKGVEAMFVDLKTSHTDVSPKAWARTSAKHNYHVQEAWYRRAAVAIGEPLGFERFKFVCVGKRPSTPVTIYTHTQYQLARADELIDQALALYRWCTETGEWPGDHPPAVTTHPQYAAYDHDEALQRMRGFRRQIAPESFSNRELEEIHNV